MSRDNSENPWWNQLSDSEKIDLLLERVRDLEARVTQIQYGESAEDE